MSRFRRHKAPNPYKGIDEIIPNMTGPIVYPNALLDLMASWAVNFQAQGAHEAAEEAWPSHWSQTPQEYLAERALQACEDKSHN